MNRPFVHRRIINVNRTVKMIAGVWICPLGLTLIPLTWLVFQAWLYQNISLGSASFLQILLSPGLNKKFTMQMR